MKELNKFGVVKTNYPLKRLTTFKIGGPAKAVIWVKKEALLADLIYYLKKHSCPYYLLGNGSNTLALDSGYNGIVIKLALKNVVWQSEDSDIFLKIGAGLKMSHLLNLSIKKGWTGLEFMAGIPATVGGAIASNAGAFGESIGEKTKKIKIFSENKILWINWGNKMYNYRHTQLSPETILLSAQINLNISTPQNVKALIKHYFHKKLTSQPLFSPSAGCVFKNPPNISAGYLIEKAGLKGKKIGGAKVSEKHANFIINTGGAKASDVLGLIELIQEKIEKYNNIKLEPEIKLVQ